MEHRESEGTNACGSLHSCFLWFGGCTSPLRYHFVVWNGFMPGEPDASITCSGWTSQQREQWVEFPEHNILKGNRALMLCDNSVKQ